jgi:hypothetical protein
VTVTNTQRNLAKIKKVVKGALKPALNRGSGWPVIWRAGNLNVIASIILKMIQVVRYFNILAMKYLYIK